MRENFPGWKRDWFEFLYRYSGENGGVWRNFLPCYLREERDKPRSEYRSDSTEEGLIVRGEEC